MPTPKSRSALLKQHDQARKIVLLSCTILGLFGMILCGYGYAATSTDLLISGEATLAATPDTFGITYMQEMTPAICAKVRVGTSEQLFDRRDHKTYWVAKMLDGNCWMTQNLALDLDPSKPLTSVDSDIAWNANGTVGSWTPPKKTETQVPAAIASPSRADTRSWNLGQYVTAVPTKEETACASVTAGKSLSTCADVQNVTGWSNTFIAEPGSWNGVNYNYVTLNPGARTYDAHYLVGNYYQYNAATAGSGANLTSGTTLATVKDAPSSICPSGWQLPVGGRNSTTTSGQPYDRDKSFYRLLAAYGYPKTGSYKPNSGNGSTTILDGQKDGYNQSYRKMPMAFTPAASVSVMDGSVRGLRTMALYWTSTAGLNSLDFALIISTNYMEVYISTQSYRSAGVPVRCVAR